MPNTRQVLRYPNSELVVGLVYPLGTDRELILRSLKDHLAKFDYTIREVRLSNQFERLEILKGTLENSPEHRRVETRMDAGNKARELAQMAEFVALAGISEVSKSRKLGTDREPFSRTVIVIDSLKRPEEVTILRKIYGAGFFLVGVFASEANRRRYLVQDKNIPEKEADRLMGRDLDERDRWGQRTRATFHLADIFVSLDAQNFESTYKDQLWRFLDLVFGHPHHTPTRDEHAMFLASAASFRSGDLSRQVGAAVTTDLGDVNAVGCNDVPRPGGGLYWPGEDDQRDAIRGFDSNHERRDRIIEDVLSHLDLDPQKHEKVRSRLATASPLADITDYGRAVHAEMEALLACARTGRSPVDGMLYTITFPCHNCTRHVVAAGLDRVVYIEPYPKSKASELHGDSIFLKDQDVADRGKRVLFEPFVGIGPRRYVDLFSISFGGGERKLRKKGPKSLEWNPSADQQVRVPMLRTSYLDREQFAVERVEKLLSNLGETDSGKID